jgi:hypothetical protein
VGIEIDLSRIATIKAIPNQRIAEECKSPSKYPISSENNYNN